MSVVEEKKRQDFLDDMDPRLDVHSIDFDVEHWDPKENVVLHSNGQPDS